MKTSWKIGQEHLDLISNILHFTCVNIKASENPIEALDKVIEICNPDNRNCVFLSSRQAIEDNLPQDTKQNLDEKLQSNYLTCMEELDTLMPN